MSDGRTNWNRECGHPYHQNPERGCIQCLTERWLRLRAALADANTVLSNFRSDSRARDVMERIEQALK